jgi:peptide/nickel transport system substrate-binding protein
MTAPLGRRARIILAAGLSMSALVLAGCSGSSGDDATSGGSSSGSTIVVGTTDKVTALDPAGSYDNGSFALMNQVFPFLFNTPLGKADVEPDIATSGSFTSPKVFTVKLKSGLTFANGDKLTSSDVKFTFDRQLKIASPEGPSSLLANLASVSAPDATTVEFHLKAANDQTFEQVLSSPAGPIVDEQVFSPTKVTSDNTIVKGDAFAGQYAITSYKFNSLVQLKPFAKYKGVLGAAKNAEVDLKYYTDDSNLKLDIQQGNIDVAYRTLSATDISSLRKDKKVKVIDGPGGEIRYIVFNFDTMPFGAKTDEASTAKSLAVRQAAADLIDRSQIASQVYKDTYTPLYSWVPDGLTGATTVLKSGYGDGKGGPSLAAAKKVLKAAGVSGPVTLNLQYNTDHYGAGSSDEYALVKEQLEKGGLFKVNLQSTEYVQYSKQRIDDYPEYQLGWYPDFSDADNYLTPFFLPDNFLGNKFSDPAVTKAIQSEFTESDDSARATDIENVQSLLAKDLPTLPLLQGSQVVVTGTDVTGATLDASFKFRFAGLSK